MSLTRKVEGLSPLEELVRDEVVRHFKQRRYPPDELKLQAAVRSCLRRYDDDLTPLTNVVRFLKETNAFPSPLYKKTEVDIFIADRVRKQTVGEHYEVQGSGEVSYSGVWDVNRRIRIKNAKNIFFTPSGLNLVWAGLPTDDGDFFRDVNESVKQAFQRLTPSFNAEMGRSEELLYLNEDQIGDELRLLMESEQYNEAEARGWVGQSSQRILRVMVPKYGNKKLSEAVRDAIPEPLRPKGDRVHVNRFLKRRFQISYLYGHEQVVGALEATNEMFHRSPGRAPTRRQINNATKDALATFESRFKQDNQVLFNGTMKTKEEVARHVFEHPRTGIFRRLNKPIHSLETFSEAQLLLQFEDEAEKSRSKRCKRH